MQIHELTQKKNTQVDEAISDIGGAAGSAVNLVKNVGSAIASPFKDIAQGYKSVRQNQKISTLADKAFRVWQNYVAQLEQSVAKQPDPVTQKKTEPPAAANAAATTPAAANAAATGTQKGQEVTLSKGDKYRFAGQQWVEVDPTTGAETGGAALPAGFQKSLTDLAAKQATTSAATAKTPPAVKVPGATPPPANGATATTPAKPNYGTQTGAGAKVTYNQPTGVPNPLQQTTPGVKQTTPGVTSATPKRPVTTEYDATVKETNRNALKELQAPAGAVSPALAAFRARTDGKYEQYLRAFVQKNLLAGMGSRELVNSAEIDQAIKEISKPENADPAKQRPLWNDLARATSLATPSARSLTDRTGKGAATAGTSPTATAPGQETPTDATKSAKPAAPTMTKDQISQWISRNSEDRNALKAALDAINSAGKA